MPKQTQYQNFLSRPEISFWVPILTSAVLIAISWANLSGRVDLLTQRIDLVIQNQQASIASLTDANKDLKTKYENMQGQWGNLSQRVTKLER